jgi:hypothetical protein
MLGLMLLFHIWVIYAYIEDGGFTARIIKILPHRRRRWLRPALLLGATAIGSVLAIFWVPWGSLPALDLSALLSPNPQVLLPWALAVAVIGSLIWSTVAALGGED